MARNTHRANCANAQRPECRCSGCGGSLHGWLGWADLAAESPQVRDAQRRRLAGGLTTGQRSGNLGLNDKNRQIYLNLARLDITDHLWATAPRPRPDGRLIVDGGADPASVTSDLGRMNLLARTIMGDTWPEISADIDNLVRAEPTARDVKKSLAGHAWCSLLVALIQLIEKITRVVDLLNDEARQFVKDAVTRQVESKLSRLITDAVINILVTRVWSAVTRLLEAHFPILNADTLRVLRMLAVFTCPWVGRHRDVYVHALEPLMRDAREIIAVDVKTQLVVLFTPLWRQPGSQPAT